MLSSIHNSIKNYVKHDTFIKSKKKIMSTCHNHQYFRTIKKDTVYKGVAIGLWIEEQKERFLGKRLPPLTPEQLKQLNKLHTWRKWQNKITKQNQCKSR